MMHVKDQGKQHLVLVHIDPQENNIETGSVDVACKEKEISIVLGT